jgi:CelD/BcsL family acetyltransferase involved in cellulose biosynthesis
MRIDAITTIEALEAQRPDWQALWSRTPDATPFQSPDWLLPWWRHLGQGDLATMAVRAADGELLALLPLYRYRQPGGHRVLLPLGIGTTDYLDVLAPPPRGVEALEAALRWLAIRDDQDGWDWPQLRQGSALLRARPPPGRDDTVAASDPCPVLPLDGDAPPIPARMRQNIRTARHRAAAAGRLEWDLAGPANWDELFGAQLDLHRARWRTRGEEGVLAAPEVAAAHRAALPGLLREGLLRLHALRLDGRIIATLYALADRADVAARRLYYYLGAFDPDQAALSPGTLVLAHAIEQAAAEGFARFDFLRGQEDYKYRWGAADRPTFRRSLRPSLSAARPSR